MNTADEQFVKLTELIREVHGQNAADLILLGFGFRHAWYTASEIRRGVLVSPTDMREYNHIHHILEGMGLVKMLENPAQ